MFRVCVLAFPVFLSLAATLSGADRYLYCDGTKAYYCKRPAKYVEGCYVVRDDSNVVRVDGYPVISSSKATTMVQAYATPASQPVSVLNPIAACCDGAPAGDCKCKDLDCEPKLSPANCEYTGTTEKEKIPYEIIGKIPLRTSSTNCYEKVEEFTYNALVPEILCTTQECVEIGTKKIECEVDECKPGCSFTVCVPVNKCITKKVECRLTPKPMRHVAYRRTDPNDSPSVSFDIYVINDADSTSPFHAGGMPKEWLVMHCATAEQVHKKFPNMLAKNKGKNIQPQETEADVNIELAFDEETLKSFLEKSSANASDSKTEQPETQTPIASQTKDQVQKS